MTLQRWLLPVVFAALLGLPARAQDLKSTVALSGTGNFQHPEATGLSVTDRATKAGGFLASYRYQFNHLSGLEVSYGYTRFTQRYTLPSGSARVQANTHETTLAWVVTPREFRDGRVRPYLLAGTGLLIFSPTGNPGGSVPGALVQDRAVFLYGAGVDITPAENQHFGLRLGYRGLLYKAPSFELGSLATGALTHMAEPQVGILFRF